MAERLLAEHGHDRRIHIHFAGQFQPLQGIAVPRVDLLPDIVAELLNPVSLGLPFLRAASDRRLVEVHLVPEHVQMRRGLGLAIVLHEVQIARLRDRQPPGREHGRHETDRQAQAQHPTPNHDRGRQSLPTREAGKAESVGEVTGRHDPGRPDRCLGTGSHHHGAQPREQIVRVSQPQEVLQQLPTRLPAPSHDERSHGVSDPPTRAALGSL
jgi:hypothetical protein